MHLDENNLLRVEIDYEDTLGKIRIKMAK